ncbi:hypothetical protein HN51_013258 [Arachis hypogaea]|nr:uncharacterized protein DS421_3g94830 [Arachis hypogaea]
MGTRQGNNNHKVADHHRISDFSLDSISLSFAGLVSIQDQQQQQQPSPTVNNNQNEHHMHNHHNHNLSSYKLPEPDFEFTTNKASSEPKNSGAAVLISNGQLVPQSSQPNRSPLNQIPQGTLGTYLATDDHHHHQQQQQRPRPRHHQLSSSMPSGQRGNPRKYHYEALGKARKHYDEGDDYDYDDDDKKKKKKKSFGKKALRSFISPCRDCKAIQASSVNKYSKTPQVSKYGE